MDERKNKRDKKTVVYIKTSGIYKYRVKREMSDSQKCLTKEARPLKNGPCKAQFTLVLVIYDQT